MSLPVDKTASQPMYRQVIQALRDRVQPGDLMPGQRVPSEREQEGVAGSVKEV